MMRLRIKELLAECNAQRPAAERLRMQNVAEAIGVHPSTLSALTSRDREVTTNTAYVEALFRFFRRHHPDFNPSMLFEVFKPSLDEPTSLRVDDLYEMRAKKARLAREIREAREGQSG